MTSRGILRVAEAHKSQRPGFVEQSFEIITVSSFSKKQRAETLGTGVGERQAAAPDPASPICTSESIDVPIIPDAVYGDGTMKVNLDDVRPLDRVDRAHDLATKAPDALRLVDNFVNVVGLPDTALDQEAQEIAAFLEAEAEVGEASDIADQEEYVDDIPMPPPVEDTAEVWTAKLEAQRRERGVEATSETGVIPDNAFELPPGVRVVDETPGVDGSLSPFKAALCIWLQRNQISRQVYKALKEVLLLATLEDLQTLPDKVDTLKNHLRSQLPTPPILAKDLPVVRDKQAVRSQRQGVPSSATIYFYDPYCIVQTMLSCPVLRNRMYFGLATLVDRPSELYHSEVWSQSIRSTSGECARLPDGAPIFPSDYVEAFAPGRIGRVAGVYKEGRTGWPQGMIILALQPCLRPDELSPGTVLDPPAEPNERVLQETLWYVPAANILRRVISVLFDREYRVSGDIDSTDHNRDRPASKRARTTRPQRYATSSATAAAQGSCRDFEIVIRRVTDGKTVRSCRLSHPIRGELELETYGREHLLTKMTGSNVISVPWLPFIDGFGLYRNVYRSLMGIYMTPANLDSRERTRTANMFPLTLGPHGADLADVLGTLGPYLRCLEEGVDMVVNMQAGRTGTRHVVCFALGVTGDMPQQADNMGFLRQSASFGCRACHIPCKDYGNLEFDVVNRGRYHHEVVSIRRRAETLAPSARKTLLRGLGMKEQPPSFLLIAPAMDLIRGAPADVPHADIQGIGRMSQTLLILYALQKSEQSAYADMMARVRYPPGWPKIQNPIRHRLSWDLGEQSRAILLTVVVLRIWLKPQHLKSAFLKAIENEFRLEIRHYRSHGVFVGGADILVKLYSIIAGSYSLVFADSQTETERLLMQQHATDCRKAFTRLVKAVVQSRSTTQGAGSIGAPSAYAGSVADIGQLNNALDEDPEEEIEPEAPASQRRQNENNVLLSAKALARWGSRPNVHAAKHYDMFATHYGIMRNTAVLSGEKYHKFFKSLIAHMNPTNVELNLLRHDSVDKTVRFVVEGAWREQRPELTQLFLRLLDLCPTLMEQFLPPSSRSSLMEDKSETLTSESPEHIAPRILGRIPSEYMHKKLSMPVRPGADMKIKQGIRRALDQHYHLPNVVELGLQNLKYYEKFTFLDRITEKRIAFTVGSDVRLTGAESYAKIRHIFTHSLLHTTRLFAVVSRYEMLNKYDDVTSFPLLRLPTDNDMEVIGLPGVDPRRPYIIPTNGCKVSKDLAPDDRVHWLCHIHIKYW